MLTVYLLMSGKESYIHSYSRGNSSVTRRLNELGLVKGTRIKVIQGSRNGSMLIKVLNSKLVINLSTAHGVIVA